MLNIRRPYKPGDILGVRRLIECLDTEGPAWNRRWAWECTKCKKRGVGRLQNVRRGTTCRYCGERTTPDTTGGEYPPGTRLGVWEIIKMVGYTSDGHRNRVYKARCTRCGTISDQKLSNFRSGAKACQHCRNKVEFAGQLLTYDELSALFGIKKSLLMDRISRRRMSIEDAVLTPIQQQDPTLEMRRCTMCRVPKPKSEYPRKVGKCKACRKKIRDNACQSSQSRSNRDESGIANNHRPGECKENSSGP